MSMNARRPERGETRIAVMLTYVDTYIFPSIIRGIESELSREGCILQIAVNDNAVEKERMVLREFIRTRVCGRTDRGGGKERTAQSKP